MSLFVFRSGAVDPIVRFLRHNFSSALESVLEEKPVCYRLYGFLYKSRSFVGLFSPAAVMNVNYLVTSI